MFYLNLPVVSCYLLTAAMLTAVSARLYATQPFSDTVWSAGHLTTVTWKDDGLKPHLEDLGSIKIELFVNHMTYVATLATGVDPRSLSHDVLISPEWWANSSNFTLHFTSAKPYIKSYTADFAVNGMKGPKITSQLQPISANQPKFTTVPFLTLPNATTPNGPTSRLTTVTPSPSGSNGDGTNYIQRNGESAGMRVNLEKARFRVVFILWPALVGISMAL